MGDVNVSQSLTEVAAAFKRPEREPSALDVVREFVGRFVYASDAELDVLTAWIAHTYVYEAYYASGRLAVMAPVKEAGKTTVLNMIVALGQNPIKTMNASAPSLFAIIDQEHPTLCFDEVDNMWGATGQSAKNRDQLGILNEGYTQDGYVLRSRNGKGYKYPVFVCAAFAGIGQLPETMASRCIPINMTPVPDNVTLEEYEPDLFRGEALRVAEMLKSWIKSRGAELDLQPPMPDGLRSRKRQIWKALIAIGDLDGVEWSARIRQAAREIALGVSRHAKISPAEELIRLVAEITEADEFMPAGDFVAQLKFQRDMEGKINWATWLDNTIVATRQLANMLRPYGIESVQKWVDNENRRGYQASDFHLWAQAQKDDALARATEDLAAAEEAVEAE
jgi:hypothetical protein